MSAPPVAPTGVERRLADDDIIVSKTDPRGWITYVNRTFLSIADYTESDVLHQPHKVIRHPDMPRTIFKLLWSEISQGREVFAYVKNMARNGDHYWVFAHVTPTFDSAGRIVGYHSNRRAPDRAAIEDISGLYRELCAIEAGAGDRKAGLAAGMQALEEKLAARGLDYDRFVFSHLSARRVA